MENILKEIAAIEEIIKEDLIVYYSEIKRELFTGNKEQQLDEADTREFLEQLSLRPNKRENVCVFLQTSGGHIAEAMNIIDELRKYYRQVSFVVWTYAGSAGSYLSLSGDRLFMRNKSMLSDFGPQNWGIGKIDSREKAQEQATLLGDLYTKIFEQLTLGMLKTHLEDAGKIIVQLGGPVGPGMSPEPDRIHGAPLLLANLRKVIPEIENISSMPTPGIQGLDIASKFKKLNKMLRKKMAHDDLAKVILSHTYEALMKFKRPVVNTIFRHY